MARLYLDTNLVIRLFEGTEAQRAVLDQRLARTRTGEDRIVSSDLVRLECLVRPRRAGNRELELRYEEFFASPDTEFQTLTRGVFDTAIDIRSVERFSTPDCLHLAVALATSCEAFLTADERLSRFSGLAVEILRVGPT